MLYGPKTAWLLHGPKTAWLLGGPETAWLLHGLKTALLLPATVSIGCIYIQCVYFLLICTYLSIYLSFENVWLASYCMMVQKFRYTFARNCVAHSHLGQPIWPVELQMVPKLHGCFLPLCPKDNSTWNHSIAIFCMYKMFFYSFSTYCLIHRSSQNVWLISRCMMVQKLRCTFAYMVRKLRCMFAYLLHMATFVWGRTLMVAPTKPAVDAVRPFDCE